MEKTSTEWKFSPQYSLTGLNIDNMQIKTEFSRYTQLHTFLFGKI